MTIDDFTADKAAEVVQLFTDVFSASEGEEEGLKIGRLVSNLIATTATEDLRGFIAREGGAIIGSIFYSRLHAQNELRAFLLSPVATSTHHQGRGVGQKLIAEGLARLKQDGIELVFTYGDPNYYSRVGFHPVSESVAKAPQPLSQPEGWLGQYLPGGEIAPIPGKLECVEAFNEPAYW